MRKVILSAVLAIWGVAASAAPVTAPVTVAALGDSLVQGYGLMQADGFVPRMQAWLDERGVDAVLINAGVSGDTTAGGAARVDWTLTPEVRAMIVVLGGNDVLRGLDPALSRANIARILQAARKADVAVLLVGIKAPGNYGPGYKQAFDRLYPELAAQYGALYAPDFFAGLGVIGGDLSQVRDLLQADGIHPNPGGVRLIVAALGPYVRQLVERAAARR